MKRNVAILVGGGPAPGINGVIAAAAIEAINRGHKALGIQNGFEYLIRGDLSAVRELTIADVSRIHSEGGSVLGTSRANPTKNPESLKNVVNCLNELNVGYLVTIGGDDTASSARAVARAAQGSIGVGHVPKTIDNDLPLPNKWSTFGYESAREVGTEIVETLRTDSKTTSRWYLVIAMGRKAGHLALGIGVSSGATLTIIPEEFGDKKVKLNTLADIIAGSMLKRMARSQPHGVVVLAEGLAEVLDQDSIPELSDAERDPHGHIRFAEVDFGGIIKNAVRNRLHRFNVKDMLALDKNVGYELRCRPPNSFDREYTQQLGYGVIDFLFAGGSEAMISRQGDELIPIPFDDMMDPVTGRSRVRMVDTSSVVYKVARKYMIRLTATDMQDSDLMEDLSKLTKLSVDELRRELGPTAEAYGTLPA